VSELFIRRPVATLLLSLALLLIGTLAYNRLPVAALPRTDVTTIQVSASLPGASPETMASSVATPLERHLGRIAGLTEMTSTSSRGASGVTLQFSPEVNADVASRNVQAAINAAYADLPSDLPSRPYYRRMDPSDTPILILALTSDVMPIPEMFALADESLAPRIARMEGVGQVFVGGGAQPAIRVEADPHALASRGLVLGDVRAAIASSTRARPSGILSTDETRTELAPTTQLDDARAVAQLTLSPPGTPIIRLSEVATVREGVANDHAAAWVDGERAVLLIIRRSPGANVIETSERVRAALPQLEAALPPSVRLATVIERSATIRAAVLEVQRALLLSVVLVVLVVFLFLRSARTTLIPTIAIPLSLAGSFAVMALAGFSVNILSLMALTIATGFVVDDAIVVTENITRHLDKGASPLEAAERGAKEITFTIISITVSLLAVFIPIVMMGGLVGRLFREMALTLALAIVISAIVSLIVTPVACAYLLKHADKAKEPAWARLLERGYERLLASYARGLDRVLRNRKKTLTLPLFAIGLSIALLMHIPAGLFPSQDIGQLFGSAVAPDDISFDALVTRQAHVSEVIRQDPAVEHVVAFAGTGPGGGAANSVAMFVGLRPSESGRSDARTVAMRISRALSSNAAMQAFITPSQDLRVGARSSRAQYQYTLQGVDVGELRSASSRLLAALRQRPQLRNVTSDQTEAGLSMHVSIDRDTASRLHISPRAIDDALANGFGQRAVATTYHPGGSRRIVLEVPRALRDAPDDLDQVRVRSDEGAIVMLPAIAHAARMRLPLSVNHQGQFPSVTLTFDVAPGTSLGSAVSWVHQAEAEIGMPSSVRGGFAGTAQVFQASLASQPLLIFAAILAVYFVLGMLYESLIHPLTILSTLPPAGVGALLALFYAGIELTVVAAIGIVLLVGIVTKNAIMMIDFALQLQRSEGVSAEHAIREAALLRFRPILMTTLAAIGGALPLAFGSGVGSELRSPLGIAIVGGLVASQALTLFTTPVVYVALDRFTKKKLPSA
jgi:multidrug efflux pump